jgi:hypothetical protein
MHLRLLHEPKITPNGPHSDEIQAPLSPKMQNDAFFASKCLKMIFLVEK